MTKKIEESRKVRRGNVKEINVHLSQMIINRFIRKCHAQLIDDYIYYCFNEITTRRKKHNNQKV